MKINEIITEAINPSTGTPNPDVEKIGNRNAEYGIEFPQGAPKFAGIKQAAQGAQALGRGIASIPGRIKGAVAGYQASQQQRKGREEAAQISKIWTNKWNEIVGANPGIKQDPVSLQNFARKVTNDIVDPPLPTDMGAAGVQKYLSQVYGLYKSQQSMSAPLRPSMPSQAPLTRRQALKLKRAQAAAVAEPSAPAAHNPQDPQQAQHDLTAGARIIQQDPIIIKYKNKQYGLNDEGQWVHFGSTKVPHQSFQAFLDKQAGFAAESIDLGQLLWNKMKRAG